VPRSSFLSLWTFWSGMNLLQPYKAKGLKYPIQRDLRLKGSGLLSHSTDWGY